MCTSSGYVWSFFFYQGNATQRFYLLLRLTNEGWIKYSTLTLLRNVSPHFLHFHMMVKLSVEMTVEERRVNTLNCTHSTHLHF